MMSDPKDPTDEPPQEGEEHTDPPPPPSESDPTPEQQATIARREARYRRIHRDMKPEEKTDGYQTR